MHTLWNDLRYAIRQLRRSPGFTLTVVLTLALGVGANAIVFSVLNALVLRPLPLPQAQQLVSLNRFFGAPGNTSPSQSYPDYRDLRDANRNFSGLAAYATKRAGVSVPGTVHESWFYEASENYFDVLGVRPALGRLFHSSDGHGPNSSPYVVLSYAYWQRQFNGNTHVMGRIIELNKHPFTVLGVAPASFRGTELFSVPDFWVPMLNEAQIEGYSFLESRGSHNVWVIGRLKPDVSVVQAESDLNTAARHLASQHMEDENLGIRLSRPGLLGDTLGRPVRAFLWGVMALAALVLLAACANLGSLFAARAADRARELAVRLALGASRAILIRQLVTEAVLVSLVGGALGLAFANAALRALTLWRPSPDFPVAVMVNADARVSALALALALASGIFFGLVPVRQVWRGNAYLVIKSGPAPVAGSRKWTLRDGLLVLQIVLCSVLVTSSLVAVRGLVRSLHTSYGFEPDGAVLATFDMRMANYHDRQALPLERRALESVSATPDVTAAGFASKIPLSLSSTDTFVYRDGTTEFRDSNAAADASYYGVSPGYLAAARTRLVSGRDFTWHDNENAPPVAIVNQTFARKVFGTTDAVGRYFNRGGPRLQVIGIVEDGKYNTLTEDPTAAMFLAAAQDPDTQTNLIVRSQDSEVATAAAVRKALTAIDPNLPVTIQSWPQEMGMALFPSVAATVALGIMGALAAMLAVTGIFGMASYAVSKRLRELGLRVALGASRRQVLAAALGRPARLLLFGSFAGLILGALASRLLALTATWLPARRALHVDPASLLREE